MLLLHKGLSGRCVLTALRPTGLMLQLGMRGRPWRPKSQKTLNLNEVGHSGADEGADNAETQDSWGGQLYVRL